MTDTFKPKHVFVLMLENRSFDHLFGFSGLRGTDAETGAPTGVVGLAGTEANTYRGQRYPVARGADFVMPVDPHHEFEDVLLQLCGEGATYAKGQRYPTVTNSGFVASYVRSGGDRDPGEVMKCFDTEHQLPALFALAQSYALCDGWHASIPGPTVPNRLFAHGASSWGLDHSPGFLELMKWETAGLSLPHGTIFDRLNEAGRHFRIYAGEGLPLVATLEGISALHIHDVADLAEDLKDPAFPADYVFIEPSYHITQSYRGSTSMHPLADVRDGEHLVKQVYEAVRGSAHWDDSVLIVTWDEHGGFYDHVVPPAAPAPGDGGLASPLNQHGFTFDRYGPRVPALVISPRIRRGTLDHRLYDHASIPKTLEEIFDLAPLTERDEQARSLLPLLAGPPADRAGHPERLPAAGATGGAVDAGGAEATGRGSAPDPADRPEGPLDDGTLPAFVHVALRQHLEREPHARDRHLNDAEALATRGDAHAYLAAAPATRPGAGKP